MRNPFVNRVNPENAMHTSLPIPIPSLNPIPAPLPGAHNVNNCVNGNYHFSFYFAFRILFFFLLWFLFERALRGCAWVEVGCVFVKIARLPEVPVTSCQKTEPGATRGSRTITRNVTAKRKWKWKCRIHSRPQRKRVTNERGGEHVSSQIK